MVLHTVHFWLKEKVSEEQKNQFLQGIDDFLSAVEEVQRAEYGVSAKTPARDVVDHSFDMSMFVLFNTVADHNVYQTHPAHNVFVESFKDLWEKVQVRDSELT